MNLSPKKDFLEKKQFADSHRELVVSNQFTTALQAALIEQVMALPDTYDPNEAAAAYYRIRGARDYIHHLLNIAEVTKTPTALPPANLNHRI